MFFVTHWRWHPFLARRWPDEPEGWLGNPNFCSYFIHVFHEWTETDFHDGAPMLNIMLIYFNLLYKNTFENKSRYDLRLSCVTRTVICSKERSGRLRGVLRKRGCVERIRLWVHMWPEVLMLQFGAISLHQASSMVRAVQDIMWYRSCLRRRGRDKSDSGIWKIAEQGQYRCGPWYL